MRSYIEKVWEVQKNSETSEKTTALFEKFTIFYGSKFTHTYAFVFVLSMRYKWRNFQARGVKTEYRTFIRRSCQDSWKQKLKKKKNCERWKISKWSLLLSLFCGRHTIKKSEGEGIFINIYWQCFLRPFRVS